MRRLDGLERGPSRLRPPSARGVPGIARTSNRKVAAVYVLECRGHCKIGFTSGSVRSRVSSMQGGNPFPITLVTHYEMEYGRAAAVEYAAMLALEGRHAHGEWFRCNRAEAIAAVEAAISKGDSLPPAKSANQITIERRLAKRAAWGRV